MSRGYDRRLKLIETAVYLGKDREEYELRKRHHYNLKSVSEEALWMEIIAGLEGSERPDWVRAEFEKPIPSDGHAWLIKESEAFAREPESGVVLDDEAIARCIEEAMCHLGQYTGRDIQSLDDVKHWLRDQGKHVNQTED